MWIVKPAAKSRGRGITTFMDLTKLLKYVEASSSMCSTSQWIVQKYIENPLIIAKRKFDIRQWVLVTDWNPLTIYFYDEFYVRFSVDEYSSDKKDLENSYVHLVNNSIGKNSENFGKIIYAENGDKIDGYMWSHESFKNFIQYTTNVDHVTNKIHPRMKVFFFFFT
jgi:tubulin monoglycylase TTLL3/8